MSQEQSVSPSTPADEGPSPGSVDEIQQVLLEASQEGVPVEVAFEELPEPLPDLDEGPPPGPVDDIQEAIFSAAQHGAPTEVPFEALPEPSRAPTKKVIRFKPPAPPPPWGGQASPAESTVPDVPVPAAPLPVPLEPVAVPVSVTPRSDFWLLLPLFLVFRLLSLLLLRPGGFLRDWSDFDTYLGIAGLSDYSLFPFFHFWLEWPPLFPWLAVGTYRLSLLLPTWPDDPRFWFILLLGTVLVLFEVGNFWLIYRLARRLFTDPLTQNRVLLLYAGLFPPVYAMLGFFDGVALFFLLLALDFLLQERRLPSAIAVGIGFMVKIIPVLLLPVALRYIWFKHRQNRREAGIELGLYVVVFGLAVVLLLSPFLVGGSEWLLASARSMLGRSSWETVWAIAEGYYGFGQVAGDRLNPAETNFAVHPGLGWQTWLLITLVFAGIYALILARPADYSRPRPVVALAGLTVLLSLLYNKGYSPQFLVYLLPFIVLLLPDSRGLTYALILTGLNVLEQPVYFVLLPQTSWLLTLVVVTRFLLLVILAGEFLLVIWPSEARLAQTSRYVPLVAGSAAGIVLVLLVPLLLRAYAAERLADSPVAAFAGFMQAQARSTETGPGRPRLLVSDQVTYRQVYPYLQADWDLRLSGGADRFAGAPKIVDLLQGVDRVWILPTGDQQQTLSSVVAEHGRAVTSFKFEDLGSASLFSLGADIPPFIAPARFSNGVELLTHQIEVDQGTVTVTLYWRARTVQSQSYKVFTQLIDPTGQRVAGHDSIPANGTAPTTGWAVDTVQRDVHPIELPPDLPPGEYTVITGLYNDFGERLLGIGPDGLGLADRVTRLGVVRLP